MGLFTSGGGSASVHTHPTSLPADRLLRILNLGEVANPAFSLSQGTGYRYSNKLINATELTNLLRNAPPSLVEAVTHSHGESCCATASKSFSRSKSWSTGGSPSDSPSRAKTTCHRELKFGISSELTSIWWIHHDHEIHFWHWPSASLSSDEMSRFPSPSPHLIIPSHDTVITVSICPRRQNDVLARCIPELAAEEALANTLMEQTQSKLRFGGDFLEEEESSRSELMLFMLTMVTKSGLEKYLLIGNSLRGAVDFIPIPDSRVSFDGKTVVSILVHSPSERVLLADNSGCVYEYQTRFIKKAFVELDVSGGAMLRQPSKALRVQQSRGGFGYVLGLAGPVFSQGWSSKVSTTGSVKKLLDIRNIRDKLNLFGTKPGIRTWSQDEESGRIFCLTELNEIYVLIIPPPVLGLQTASGNVPILSIMERETICCSETVVVWENFLQSILTSVDVSSWLGPQEQSQGDFEGIPVVQVTPMLSTLDKQRRSVAFINVPKDKSGSAAVCADMKGAMQIAGLHCLKDGLLLVVLSDGTRCLLKCTTRDDRARSWISSEDSASLLRVDKLEGASALQTTSYDVLGRSVDPRRWQFVQELLHPSTDAGVPAGDPGIQVSLVSVKRPPPAMFERSPLRTAILQVAGAGRPRGLDTAVVAMGGAGRFLTVTRSYHTGRGGGMTLLEVDASEGRERRATVLALGPDFLGADLELCEWVEFEARSSEAAADDGEGTTAPLTSVRWLDMLATADLPLEEGFENLDVSQDLALVSYDLRYRLGLACATVLARRGVSSAPGPVGIALSAKGGPVVTPPPTESPRRSPSRQAGRWVSFLASSMEFARGSESLDFLTATQLLPGPCFLSICEDNVLVMTRVGPRELVMPHVSQLEKLSLGLLTDLKTLMKSSVLFEPLGNCQQPGGEFTPESLVRTFVQQKKQFLPALTVWARLATRPGAAPSNTPGDFGAHNILPETALLFSFSRQEAALDLLWSAAISEELRNRKGPPLVADGSPAAMPLEPLTPFKRSSVQHSAGRLRPHSPLTGRLAGPRVSSGTFPSSSVFKSVSRVSASPIGGGHTSFLTCREPEAATHVLTVVRLLVLLPVLNNISESLLAARDKRTGAGYHQETDHLLKQAGSLASDKHCSSRIASLRRCLLRTLLPFVAVPLFRLQIGPDLLTPKDFPPTKGFIRHDAPLPQRRTLQTPATTESTDNTRTTRGSTPPDFRSSSNKRPLNEPGESVTPKKTRHALSTDDLTPSGLPESKDAATCFSDAFRIHVRFSEKELDLGGRALGAILSSIENYEAFVNSQIPLEIKSRIAEDSPNLAELKVFCHYIRQIFCFLILVRRSNQISEDDTTNVVGTDAFGGKDGGKRFLLEADIFDYLVGVSLIDLLGSSTAGAFPIFQRWLQSESSGGLKKILSASCLHRACPDLFGTQALAWAAALEPLECLGLALEKQALERRQCLKYESQVALSVASRDGLARRSQGRELEVVSELECEMANEPVAVLEYLWSEWTAKRPELVADLQVMMPLPRFLQMEGDSEGGCVALSLFSEGGDSLRRELREHVMVALACAVAFPRSSGAERSGTSKFATSADFLSEYLMGGRAGGRVIEEDRMFRSLVEQLFQLHVLDGLVLALAVWTEMSRWPLMRTFQRSSRWTSLLLSNETEGGVVLSGEKDVLSLPKPVAEALCSLLDRLKTVSHLTEGLVAHGLADALVAQLTRKPLPSLAARLAQAASNSRVLSAHDALATEAFAAAFDSNRSQLEERLASACFLWMISSGSQSDVTFPRALGALQSPHLAKWLDSVAAGSDEDRLRAEGETVASTVQISVAVAEFFIREGNFGRALHHLTRLIEMQPKWLVFPVEPEQLAQSAFSRLTGKPGCGAENELGAEFPTTTLAAARGIVSEQVAADFGELFREKWLAADCRAEWRLVRRLCAALRRLGDLSTDVRGRLVARAHFALARLRADAPPADALAPFARPTFAGAPPAEGADRFALTAAKIVFQRRLLDDLLEFLCFVVAALPDVSALVLAFVNECDGGEPSEPPTEGAPARLAAGTGRCCVAAAADQALFQNILSFVVMSMHATFATISSLFDHIVEFVASLKNYVPFNATILFEIWAAFPLERPRLLGNKNIQQLMKHGSRAAPLDPDLAVMFLAMMSAVQLRNSFFRTSFSLGFFEELALRYWNCFATHALLRTGATGGSVAMAPVALFLALDRVLRCNFGEKEEKDRAMDAALAEFFASRKCAHAEKLRCVNQLGFGGAVHADVVTFRPVLPLADCGPRLVGSVSGFAVDAVLRAWLWDLVGLTRDENTGARLRDARALSLQPRRCANAARPVTEWLLRAAEHLQAVLAQLLGLDDYFRCGEERLADSTAGLLAWLDAELPMQLRGDVQHLTPLELAYSLTVALEDLFTAVGWFATVGLPCFAETARLTGVSLLLLKEAPRAAAADPGAAFAQQVVACAERTAAALGMELHVSLADWRGLAEVLLGALQAVHKLHREDVLLKGVFQTVTAETSGADVAGGDEDETKKAPALVQTMMRRLGCSRSLARTELLPGLQRYVDLLRGTGGTG